MCQELTETAKKRQYVYLLFLIIKLKKPNDEISLVTKDSDKIQLHFYITDLMLWYWRKNNFHLWQALKLPFSRIQLSETSVVKEVSLKGW